MGSGEKRRCQGANENQGCGFFCSQLEASLPSCFGELFCLQLELFYSQLELFYLQLALLHYSGIVCVCLSEHLNGLQAQKLTCKQKSSNCKQKSFPENQGHVHQHSHLMICGMINTAVCRCLSLQYQLRKLPTPLARALQLATFNRRVSPYGKGASGLSATRLKRNLWTEQKQGEVPNPYHPGRSKKQVVAKIMT